LGRVRLFERQQLGTILVVLFLLDDVFAPVFRAPALIANRK